MELSDYLRVLRKFWVSVIAFTLAGLAGGALLSLLATPTFTSTAQLFLTVQSADSAGDLAQGSNYTERQVKSFAEIAEAPVVLQPVIDGLGLVTTPATLAQRVTVSVPTNTSILDIAVEDTDAQRAADTAGGIADEVVAAVATMAPKDAQSVATVEATMISPAVVPTGWTTPRVAQNLLLGLIVGLFVGVGQAVLREMLDTKVRNEDDVKGFTDVPVVGSIVDDEAGAKRALTVMNESHTPRAEDYRRLRTNLQFLGVNESGGRSMVVSSSIADEGKTTTILNLGLALAGAGKRVLLVDADLRRPRIAGRLKLESAVGLTTVLVGRASLDDVVQRFEDGELDVLAAGQVPPNPSELLGSDAMRDLLAEATASYDYVLIDSAPLVPVTDTAVLSHLVGGVLLVVGSGSVDRAQVSEAVESVRSAEGQVLGIVLNKLKGGDAGSRSSVYYSRDSYTEDPVALIEPRKQANRPARAVA